MAQKITQKSTDLTQNPNNIFLAKFEMPLCMFQFLFKFTNTFSMSYIQ